MRTFRRSGITISLLAMLVLVPRAHAQDTTASTLVVERIHNGFVIAPDFKLTELDEEVGQLAGVYAGRVIDDRLLVGAAAYWLANGSDAFKLAYGGVLVGWSSPSTRCIRFGGRGLAGVGTATRGTDIEGRFPRGFDRSPAIRFGARTPAAPPARPTIRVRVADDFLVFEPQATFAIAVMRHIAIDAGVGYRAVALTDALRDRLDGPTASVALQLDW
jgi:hypothetical protein